MSSRRIKGASGDGVRMTNGMLVVRRMQRLVRTAQAANGRRPRLIFVLGSQRSGTNALRRSLSLDPYVMGFNESKSSALYEDWMLRPEPLIRSHLEALRGTVLLKPIQSVLERDVAGFLSDFRRYRLDVAWIYRDPVNVYASYAQRWPSRADHQRFCEDWIRVNRSAVHAAANDARILVVRYEDLVADRQVFSRLCRRLDVHGEYLFSADSNSGYHTLDGRVRDDIVAATADVRAQLDEQRPLRSGLH